jgi:hypothetical protein
MTHHRQPARRAQNQASRALFEEARRNGLVQRHLRKLHHLARHRTPPTASTPTATTDARPGRPVTTPACSIAPRQGAHRRPKQLALNIEIAHRPKTPSRRPSASIPASHEAA